MLGKPFLVSFSLLGRFLMWVGQKQVVQHPGKAFVAPFSVSLCFLKAKLVECPKRSMCKVTSTFTTKDTQMWL